MRLAATAIAIALVVTAVTAKGASRVVVVDDADRSTRAATERLRGELAAAGFEVVPRSARAGDARDDVEGAAADEVATVRLVRNPQTRATEMWVSDRLTGKTLVRRVNADPERSPRLVALRVVELLRASLLELASPPHDDAPPPTPPIPTPTPPPPEIARLIAPPPAPVAPPEAPPARLHRRPRWIAPAAIQAGVTMIASTDHLGPAMAPTLGVWIALPAFFAARVGFVGPAFQSGLANAAGSAVVRQELASVDLAWSPDLTAPVAPFVAVGAGPYHLHVQGTGTAPYHGASDDAWGCAFGGGVGVGFRITQGVALAVEGRAVDIAPHPAVTIGGERVASAGSPSLLASAALVASF